MRIRFNKYERVAGMFVGIAILSCVVGFVAIAVKNGWLASKVNYATELESADGIHAGTAVQIAGLRVGQVTAVELESNDRVMVRFEILEKFAPKIRADSNVHMFRPFILSDKVLDISVGSEQAELVGAGGVIPTVASTDVMDLLSGKKMTAVLSSFDHLADSLRIVGKAFSDPKRTHGLVQMLDRLNPLVENLNVMSLEVSKIATVANKKQRAEVIVNNLAEVSTELQRALPSFNKEVPDLGRQLGMIVKNLNILTTEFQKLTPAISAVAPELPRTSRRAIEALDETVVVLKALQRSFLLRGNVNSVRQEEGRRPANTSEP